MKEIKEYVNVCVNAIDEKKGIDIKTLNITGLSPIADYFVIATGNNPNQLHAICDEVTEQLSKEGLHPRQTEGYQSGSWILIDYGDFIVHLFNPESRDFYNIERIWKDAKVE